MRRPARALVKSKLKCPRVTARSGIDRTIGHATGMSPSVVHHGRHLGGLVLAAIVWLEPAD
jgi:hypothetical protein